MHHLVDLEVAVERRDRAGAFEGPPVPRGGPNRRRSPQGFVDGELQLHASAVTGAADLAHDGPGARDEGAPDGAGQRGIAEVEDHRRPAAAGVARVVGGENTDDLSTLGVGHDLPARHRVRALERSPGAVDRSTGLERPDGPEHDLDPRLASRRPACTRRLAHVEVDGHDSGLVDAVVTGAASQRGGAGSSCGHRRYGAVDAEARQGCADSGGAVACAIDEAHGRELERVAPGGQRARRQGVLVAQTGADGAGQGRRRGRPVERRLGGEGLARDDREAHRV